MKQKKLFLSVAAVLGGMLAGGMLEHVRVTSKASVKAAQDVEKAKAEVSVSAETRDLMSLQSANDALRSANEQLRRRLAEAEQTFVLNGEEAVVQDAVSDVEPAREEKRSRRESFSERMARIRQENPDAYAEMQQRRDEFRQQMAQRTYDRDEFLAAIDVKNMNEAQRENHEKLLETSARLTSLMEQMESVEGERRRELWREMAESGMVLDELYREERRYLFDETARSVGYQGNDAEAFTDHMQTIIDNTSIIPSFGRGRGGRGGLTSE